MLWLLSQEEEEEKEEKKRQGLPLSHRHLCLQQEESFCLSLLMVPECHSALACMLQHMPQRAVWTLCLQWRLAIAEQEACLGTAAAVAAAVVGAVEVHAAH